jgi:flavin reductase (DIM6/NTAB) family NADH-FMN oxidoreductase RutF
VKTSLGAKTLIYPTPVLLVGTYDKNDQPNVMTVAWGGVCCSSPPCVAVSLRKATYTYKNIVERKAFSINIPSERYVIESDYVGMVSGKKENKFLKTGLTAVRCEHVDAPYIEEFPLILECRLFQTVEIGLHIQFIGEIVDTKVEDSVLGEGKIPDVEKVKPIMFAPYNSMYHGVGRFLGPAFSIGKKIKAA